MFKVVVGLKDIGTFPRFSDAFRRFVVETKTFATAGTTWNVLEGACYIELSGQPMAPMHFSNALRFGYEHGLLRDGELCPALAEPDIRIIMDEYARIYTEAFRIWVRDILGPYAAQECQHPSRDRIVIRGGQNVGRVLCTNCESMLTSSEVREQ